MATEPSETPTLPMPEDVTAHVAEVFRDPTRQPDIVQPYLGSPEHGHPAGTISGVRTAAYKGRLIEVRTTYQIRVDGEPFLGHLEVGHDGSLHCHSIPYHDHVSAVDFVRRLIDIYPRSFPAGGGPGDGSSSEGDMEEHLGG